MSKSIRAGSKFAVGFGVPLFAAACYTNNVLAIITSIILVALATVICIEGGD